MSFNKIILVGNLTRDIELKYTQSGSAIASTGIATTRKFTSNGEKKEEVCFVDITFFGKSAEVANQYLRKGSKILVDGRLKLDQWTDNQSGQKRSKHGVVVESMQMLDSKPKNDNQPNYQQPQQKQQQQYQAPQPQYQNQQGQQVTQQQYQHNQQQGQVQVSPSIDVDENEMPF